MTSSDGIVSVQASVLAGLPVDFGQDTPSAAATKSTTCAYSLCSFVKGPCPLSIPPSLSLSLPLSVCVFLPLSLCPSFLSPAAPVPGSQSPPLLFYDPFP